jgi:uncharacterized protein (DUF1501 family)
MVVEHAFPHDKEPRVSHFSKSGGRAKVTGELTRRELLRLSAIATGSAALPYILRLRAAAAQGKSSPQTAVIFVQLGGGASQFETYDPKPDAPAEYRGDFGVIATSVPGVRFCELLPQQARLMHELAIVRSVQHREASHIALHVVETGYFLRNISKALKGEMPAVGAVAARLRPPLGGELPGFVSLPRAHAYSGPNYLGGQYAAFTVNDDPSAADFQVSNLALAKGLSAEKLADRRRLLTSFDAAARAIDGSDTAQTIDVFQRQALELLTSPKARTAFDLAREPDSLRDRYGRNAFGQRLLLARRLVEAGVPFIAVRMADWDDHDKLAERIKQRAPIYDQGIAALVTDLRERGMTQEVLVVAMGEFGRTPRVNQQAGRDHWPAVSSVLFAGGRYRMGQVIGASDSKGAAVAEAPYPPQSVLAMVYRHLGIDPAAAFPDFTGRPRYILEERQPIGELM